MANFPTSLDTLTNPAGSDTLASPSHSSQHTVANDILEAVEAKLGITSSTPASATLLAGTGSGTSEWLSHASADVQKASDSTTHAGSATAHHPAPAAGPDADVTVDAAGAAGTAATFARSGHGHKLATSSATPGAVSTAGAAGTSTTAPSRGDHVHAHEAAHLAHDTLWDAAGDLVIGTGADTAAKLAITVPAANILNVLGVVNGETTWSVKAVHDSTNPAAIGTVAPGTSLLSAHRDHVHATGAGTPSTQAIGDAAATGTGPAAAMTDHKHAITNPLTTQYDLWMGGASGAPGRLAKGSNYQRLEVNGSGVVGWTSRAGVELARSANQAISASTDTAITFPTETTDTDNGHTASASAYTIPAGMGGWWHFTGYVEFSSDSSGGRFCWLYKNAAGTPVVLSKSSSPAGGGVRQLAVAWVGKLSAGDTVELYVNTAAGVPNVNPANLQGVFLGL